MELIEVLHVPEDDVLLVDNARRNLLHTASHLPQVRLHTQTHNTHRELDKNYKQNKTKKSVIFTLHVTI